MTTTRLMLGRRPNTSLQQAAFGHVALNIAAQTEIETIVQAIATRAVSLTKVAYDPDDAPQAGEVMFRKLAGIDQDFQPNAPWSLERANKAASVSGKPSFLDATDITDGGWTFYALRAAVDGKAAMVIRATSPTRALKHSSRFITQMVGGELRPMNAPLAKAH